MSHTSKIENIAYLCKLNSCQAHFKQLIFKSVKVADNDNDLNSRLDKVEENCAPCTVTDEFGIEVQSLSSTGAVLEGFLRFPETTQDFPSAMGAPLFGYNISRGIHCDSGLNSSINWPLFQLEVKEM